MERIRIEKLEGMQRNPVEGVKSGPDVLRNLTLARAGGYEPFARTPSTPFVTLGAASTSRLIGHDAMGQVSLIDTRSASESGFTLARGNTRDDSVSDFDAAIADLASVAPRFGAYVDRYAYFGRGLADGSLNVEPLEMAATVELDTLDATGTEVASTASQALAFVPPTGADAGYVYFCLPSGVLQRLDLSDPEAAPTTVTDLSGPLGSAPADMAYGEGWLVVLSTGGTVVWSNDDFSTSGSASLGGTGARLSWDPLGARFYAGGSGLWRSSVVSAATGPVTWSVNIESRSAAQPGAGVVNIDGDYLVAPLTGDNFVDYSEDGGANWPLYRGTLVGAGVGLGRETLKTTGDGRGVATDGALTVLAVDSAGGVHRRKDALLTPGSVQLVDLEWTVLAEEVDGTGVALNAIAWNDVRDSWFVVTQNGGVFESDDGEVWAEVGRSANPLTRIVFDAAGNWYASGAAADLLIGSGALGAPAGQYAVAVVCAIPTPAGELVTNLVSLSAQVTEALPAALRVSAPTEVTAPWFETLTAAEQAAYTEAARIYVYVGYDADFATERPAMRLVKLMSVGDDPFLVRQTTLDGLSADQLQAINLVGLRDCVAELHNERLWFTIPEAYELRTGDRPVYTAQPSAGDPSYYLAGNATQAQEIADGFPGRRDITDGAGAGILGAIPVSLGSASSIDVDVTVQSRAQDGRTVLFGSYVPASVTLAPGESTTVVLPPVDAGSGLVSVEAQIRLNGGGTSLELVSVTAVTPLVISGYGSQDFGYYLYFRPSIPAMTATALTVSQVDIANTDLQVTSEGGKFTVAWTEAGFMNLADPLNYLKVSSSTSERITDLASGPGQALYVFCDNEIFAIYGDPGLDQGARIENFGVQRIAGVVGHDVDTPVARVGNQLFCVHRGRVYAVTEQGVTPQPISALVDRRDDPVTQVIGDSGHNHVVALTESGRVLRFDLERQAWFEDPWSSDSVAYLVPRAAGFYGSQVLRSDALYGIEEPASTDELAVRLAFEDFDLGEKNLTKLWRRVRLHTSDELEDAPRLTYECRGRSATVDARRSESGVWVFTLGRGVVGPKINLDFEIANMPGNATLEAPVDIEFVPRYVER